MNSKKKKTSNTPEIQNRKARHNYQILETLETGIVLKGTEVKSTRAAKVNIGEAWIDITPQLEMFLVNSNIEEYSHGNQFNHQSDRRRKLLAHQAEIIKFHKAKELKGLTIIPLKLYFNAKGYAKLQIGLGRGKDMGDKRQDMIQRTQKREMDRAMKGAMR